MLRLVIDLILLLYITNLLSIFVVVITSLETSIHCNSFHELSINYRILVFVACNVFELEPSNCYLPFEYFGQAPNMWS